MEKLTKDAKRLESTLFRAMSLIYKVYQLKYPKLEYKSSLSKVEIAELRGIIYKPQNLKSCIKPDGGMIFLGKRLLS